MLTRFFFTLREAGVPVSLTEHLTLLEALEARVASLSVDDFYWLARATLVKDEKHFDRFDRAFAAHFKGVEQAFASLDAALPEDWLPQAHRARLHRGGEGADRGAGRLGEADADARGAAEGAEGPARRRQQVDRHRRHLAVRPRRLQPGGHPHRRARRPEARGQGLGAARLPQPRRQRRARHAQHQDRAPQAAPLRARGRGGRVRPRRHHRRDGAQRRTAGPQVRARAAQRREGAAVPGRRRLDGEPRARVRGAVLGDAQRVQAPRVLLLPQLPVRVGVEGRAPAPLRAHAACTRSCAPTRPTTA